MFFSVAKVLAYEVSESDLEQGRVYPPLSNIREVSLVIATAVAQIAYKQGLARKPEPDDIRTHIKSLVYEPDYNNYA